MTTELLLTWWNLIFIVPFLLAVVYLGFYAVSGITFGESGVDVDADVDADGDLGADGAVDADADAGAHAEAGVHVVGHPGGDSPVPAYLSVLTWLGLGRVPLSILLMVLMLSWGAAGFITNALLVRSFDHAYIPPISLPVAGLSCLVFTSCFARLIGRYAPLSETYARRRHELLGLVGEAIFPIDSTFGMVTVRDDRGERFDLPCRTSEDSPAIAKGERVRLVGYSAKRRLFYVVRETLSRG